jgi:hypothetical protein
MASAPDERTWKRPGQGNGERERIADAYQEDSMRYPLTCDGCGLVFDLDTRNTPPCGQRYPKDSDGKARVYCPTCYPTATRK